MPRRRKKSDSATYWHDRAIQLTQKQLEEDTNLVETFSKEYMRLKFDLEKELAVFYQRYADNEGISMAEARKLLKGAELKNFRMGLDEFREKAIQGGFEKELDEVYLRSRVSRLQALQAQLDMHAKALHSEQEQTLTEHLGARYKDTYYRTVYAISQQNTIASTFAHVDRETLDKVLSSPWLEDNFSGRIWENRDKLIRELRQTLSRGIVRGDSLDEMTKALAKQMDTAESRAATLVHTESAHIAAEASLAGYKETGIQRYTFDATLDSKTCSYCGQMDQLQFPLSEQETGVNYPPLHPRCRCTTLPVTGFQIGSKRAARNPETGKTEYVEKGLTYEEWHKKYIENDPENAILDIVKQATGARQQKPLEIKKAVIGANPNFSKGEAYRVNCQRCVQAYELRRRGYDVVAKPKPSTNNVISWGSECFIQPEEYQYSYQAYTLNQTEAAVKKVFAKAPDGSRFSVYIVWKGTRGKLAHVFIAEKNGGVVRYLDPQAGSLDASGYFARGSRGRFGYFRLDDKKLTTDPDIISATVEVNK